MCEFSAQQKIHYNGQANSNEWDCECELECESRKRQMSRRGKRGGGEPMHKHDENVLQFAVKFARCVYFQIMRKLFAYAPNKGAGWGMLGKGRPACCLGEWELAGSSQQRSSFQYTFVSLPPLSCVFAQNAISHICITADRAQIAQIAQNKVEICSARRSAVLWLHH